MTTNGRKLNYNIVEREARETTSQTSELPHKHKHFTVNTAEHKTKETIN